MAIAFDNSTVSTNSSSSSLTFSHTVSGTNTILIVGVCTQKVGGVIPSGVTYNGTSLTAIDNQGNGNPNINSSLWYLINPTTGANNVVVSATSPLNIIAGAISLTGVAQSSPIGATAKSNGGGGTTSTPSTSITTTVNNSWVVDVLGCGSDGALSATGTNQTERYSSDTSPADHNSGGSTETTTTAGSYTLSWNQTNNVQYSQVLAEIKPATAVASSKLLLLMGVGT